MATVDCRPRRGAGEAPLGAGEVDLACGGGDRARGEFPLEEGGGLLLGFSSSASTIARRLSSPAALSSRVKDGFFLEVVEESLRLEAIAINKSSPPTLSNLPPFLPPTSSSLSLPLSLSESEEEPELEPESYESLCLG